MLTRGQLWNNTAKQGVHVCLSGEYRVQKHSVFYQSQRSFITRTFNTKAEHMVSLYNEQTKVGLCVVFK